MNRLSEESEVIVVSPVTQFILRRRGEINQIQLKTKNPRAKIHPKHQPRSKTEYLTQGIEELMGGWLGINTLKVLLPFSNLNSLLRFLCCVCH